MRLLRNPQKVSIRRAESPEDIEALFRFRYAVYVEEMNRAQRHADHLLRRIEEPLDATGANFIALVNDRVVGSIRWNSGANTDFGEYAEFYSMECAGPYFPRHCGITTKLMVSPEYRRSALGIQLCLAGYEYARNAGLVADFMDCNPHLERQFLQFGYRMYRERFQHPEYGTVLPMVLVCADLEHLERVRSPFAAIEARFPRQPEAVRYFREKVLDQNSPASPCKSSNPELHPRIQPSLR